MKVAICVPCHGGPRFQFMRSFGSIILTSAPKIAGLVMIESANLPYARNRIAADAVDAGADKLLWLDADMVLPHDTLERLLAHDKAFVGVNYRRRSEPGAVATSLAGPMIMTTPDKTGLEEVRFTGLGAFLMDVPTLTKVPGPWFHGGQEDVFFFAAVRRCGFQVFVDHDLSREVGHVTDTVLTF